MGIEIVERFSYQYDLDFESDESEDDQTENQKAKLAPHFYETKDNITGNLRDIPVIEFNPGTYDAMLI